MDSVLKNIIRIGRVSSVNEELGSVEVVYEDKDDIVTDQLPLMAFDYYIPNPKDLVLCVHLPNGITTGFCLWRYYNDENKPLIQDKNVYYKEFHKEAILKYSKTNKTLSIEPWGESGLEVIKLIAKTIQLVAEPLIELTAQETIRLIAEQTVEIEADSEITLTAPQVVIDGNLSISGTGGGGGELDIEYESKTENATDFISSHAGSQYTISSDDDVLITAETIHLNGTIYVNGNPL